MQYIDNNVIICALDNIHILVTVNLINGERPLFYLKTKLSIAWSKNFCKSHKT